MSASFQLDPRLEADSLPIAELGLCSLRLMDDQRFPWLLLVPRRAGLREVFELSAFDQAELLIELNHAARALGAVAAPHKLNLGALGNIVQQLHLHLVARQPDDVAWPGPVWGSGARQPYAPAAAQALIARLRQALHDTREPVDD
ncbi:HIT domain-containing protein [Aquimonas voraii]|uniref:Diadenosine tetraphosphate (Ap4A) hydrolase n=1 Tax=Aquimonas voraii TaxID=265719 RepID=A0A1G6U0B3_9GAMM|nr:HIT family protein [Aquimonas voraii]SDD34634.1 Diadenosine tetraphosphate (Ap4A) hydrolase [Aquimonas voraii]